MTRPKCVQENATRNETPMPRRVASPRRQDVCRAERQVSAFSRCEMSLLRPAVLRPFVGLEL